MLMCRLKGIKDWPVDEPRPRKRSNSLPIPKIEVRKYRQRSNSLPIPKIEVSMYRQRSNSLPIPKIEVSTGRGATHYPYQR